MQVMTMREQGGAERTFRDRLSAYADQFRADFRRRDQVRWLSVYLQLLLHKGKDGGREDLPHSPVPDEAGVEDVAQALQNFVNQSPWDERKLWQRYRALVVRPHTHPDGIFVVNDITFPKQGHHSVGVLRQYSSALGKKINCQVGVAVHYVSEGHYHPLGLRLYLPQNWLRSPGRLEAAGVPVEFRRGPGKQEIALQLLDEVCADGLPGRYVAAGPGYGNSAAFRAALAERGFSYLAEVPEEWLVFPEAPRSPTAAPVPEQGAPSSSSRHAPGGVTLRQLAEQARSREPRRPGHGTWVNTRLHAAAGDRRAAEEPTGVFLGESADGTTTYALGNLRSDTLEREAARLWEAYGTAEHGCRRLDERLGLSRFEGRSWRGFHHHACLVMLAHGFLATEAAVGFGHDSR